MVPPLHVPLNNELLINCLKNEGDENLPFARSLFASKEGAERKIPMHLY